MESNWAAEHLQVIRTLMERSAIYRHALAPIMIFLGVLGLAAAAGGWILQIETLRAFAGFWLAVAVLAVIGTLLIARRQALKDADPFWSPPTRRVTQAVLPALAAGLFFSLFLCVFGSGHMRWLFIFPNIFFYACAVHAAGFFMPRGMKLFAWLVIGIAVAVLLVLPMVQTDPNAALDHALMGFFFGVLHLAYGVYLYFTEKRKNAA